MPRTLTSPPNTPFAGLPRIRWNVLQFENLFTMGLLSEKGYELIDGDVIEKMPIKRSHAYIVTLLFALFSRSRDFPRLLTQFSLWINDETLPEPDFAVLKTSTPTLTPHGYIQPSDIELVVEVSDATLARDITAKAALYARAGIPEYWVIDVVGRRLLIHCDAQPDSYAQVTEYTETESAAPLFAPMESFNVADILPS